MSIIFIAGIDTGIGKTEATGQLARLLRERGINAVTQKLIQTGQTGTISEDILRHRELMEIDLLQVDMPLSFSTGTLTCPYSFAFPSSPHLAAEREGRTIDTDKLTEATEALHGQFPTVLVEGTGGLFVPIRCTGGSPVFMIDYFAERRYPVILVTSGKLGSINHTFLALEALRHRHIPLAGLIFNQFPSADETTGETADKTIAADTLALFRRISPYVLSLQIAGSLKPDAGSEQKSLFDGFMSQF